MDQDARHSVQITDDNDALFELTRLWGRPEFSAENGIAPLNSLYEAGDCAVAVVRMEEEGIVVLGSGAMVGPGLILTATHVLDDFVRDGRVPLFMTFLPGAARAWLPKDFDALAREHKYDAGRTVTSDIALVSCTLNSEAHPEHPLTLTPMEVSLPLLGDRLWAIGFRHHDPDSDEARLTPLLSSGLVTAAYPFGRDERMPGACIEVAMDTLGGMSGGAVYNASGCLIGIVSSSFAGGPTYVTLLWDAIRLTVRNAVPKLLPSAKTCLLAARDHGLVKLKGDVDRDPWGEVTFRLSDDQSKFFNDSIPASEKAQARIPAMTRDELYRFVDESRRWMENAVEDAAIETLSGESLEEVKKWLSASKIPAECFGSIVGFSVENLDGVEDLTVTSAFKMNDGRVGMKFHFLVRHLIWTVEVPKREYEARKPEFLKYFVQDQDGGDAVQLLVRQRCYFKGVLAYDKDTGTFEDVTIISGAVVRRRRPSPTGLRVDTP